MPRDARDCRQVQAVTKRQSNAEARARRGAEPSKAHAVTLVDVELDGQVVLLAVSASDDSRGYILRRDDAGTWRCGCFNRRFSVGHTCAHEVAANARDGG